MKWFLIYFFATMFLFVSCGATGNLSDADNAEINVDADSKKVVVDNDSYVIDDNSYDDTDDTDGVDAVEEQNDVDADNFTEDQEMEDIDNVVVDEDIESFSCSENAIQVIMCPEDAEKFQKQVCISEIWSDDGVCYSPINNVIPTQQTKCYNTTEEISCPQVGEDYYGQDAHYLDTKRVFTVQGTTEEIVIDSMTTLEWQRLLPSVYDGCTKGDPVGSQCVAQEGVEYCSHLNYSGYTDWRLPTIEELSTLPDYGKYDPAVDEIAFLNILSEWFWSSSTYPDSASGGWLIGLENGGIDGSGVSNPAFVICVRGEYNMRPSFSVSTISEDTVVIDSRTGLVWQQSAVSNKVWKDALSYCEELSYAEKTDWRLPNLNELRTIVSYEKLRPAIDQTVFPETPSDRFWSSTSSSQKADFAWYVKFSDAEVNYGPKESITSYVRCVR